MLNKYYQLRVETTVTSMPIYTLVEMTSDEHHVGQSTKAVFYNDAELAHKVVDFLNKEKK